MWVGEGSGRSAEGRGLIVEEWGGGVDKAEFAI